MNDYSKKILKVPTVTFVREQDQGKQPVLDVRNLGCLLYTSDAADEL